MNEGLGRNEILAKQLTVRFLKSRQGKRFMDDFFGSKTTTGETYTMNVREPLTLWEKICTVVFLPVTVPLFLILYVPFYALQFSVFFAYWGWVSLWRYVSKR